MVDTALAVTEIHNELLSACYIGDLNRIFQLSYYHGDKFTNLIKGEVDGDICSKCQDLPGKFSAGEYLHLACLANQVTIAQHLIKLGANMNKSSNHGSPFDIACTKGSLELVKLLVNSGFEIAPNNFRLRESGLYMACLNGHFDVIEYLISLHPNVLNDSSEGFSNGSILLYAACSSGNLDLVQYLVRKGVDVNALVPTNEGVLQPPLHIACSMGYHDIVKFLIDEKAEIPRELVQKFPDLVWDPLSRSVKKASRSYSVQLLTRADYRSGGMTANLEDKKLYAIHESWFTDPTFCLTCLNLHHNNIGELPANFFQLLPNLEDLDLSVNQLVSLPRTGLSDIKLLRLSASRNQLSSVPLELFLNCHILGIDLSYNELKCLPPDELECDNCGNSSYEADGGFQGEPVRWACSSLKTLKLNNNEIMRVPKSIQGACHLEKLHVSNNLLNTFDGWRCQLNDLDLSGNQLESFGGNVEMVWAKSLSKLNLSRNRLRSISWNICRLEKLAILDVSHNQIDHLPRIEFWQTKVLSKLNLSNNLLSGLQGPEGFADVSKTSVEDAIKFGANLYFPSNCDLPVDAFKDSLQILDLSDNRLESLPESVSYLTSLSELDLSNNPRIRALPYEMGNLRNIWNLRLNNLDLQDLPQELKVTKHTKDVLAFLRAKLRKSVPFNRMKLMVVGLQERGKTTLLATLQGKKSPPNISTVGVSVGNWQLQASRISMSSTTATIADKLTFWKAKQPTEQSTGDIIFSTWDLAGQHVYYATHQCFLTSNTLYLVVWNATHGIEGVESLAPWLLNIQARAPQSRVITVGTYIDLIPESARFEQLGKLEIEIMQKYDRKGFPVISGNCFVSNVTGEGLQRLRDLTFKVASKMQDSNLQEPMIGKKVPLSYLQLYDKILKEAARRRETNEPPILTADEMLELAKQNTDNDILDIDELNHAARFLHDSGILLHFNDQLRGLSHLFFIDPPWLCDMLAMVVTVPQRNSFVVNGCLKKKDVSLIMKDPRLLPQYIPQYLQILERFEIALRLDDEYILIPSMLPKEPPNSVHPVLSYQGEETKRRFTISGSISDDTLRSEKTRYGSFDESVDQPQSLCRNYHMRYIPTGFWGRLIARIVTAVHRWGMVLMSEESDTSEDGYESMTHSKGITKATDYSMSYWREGIMVEYNVGHFLVEAFKDPFETDGAISQGIAVTVWSWCRDFSVMGFLTDQIDLLITEWYPGLEDVDEFGMMMIQKLIPCPSCVLSYQKRLSSHLDQDYQFSSGHKSFLRDPDIIYQFSLPWCALAAVNCQNIQCPSHPESPVPLTDLVPDLMLTDMPPHLVIDQSKFQFEPTDDNRLGEGGAGGVYKGLYQEAPVAIKQFHSSSATRLSGNFATSALTEMSMLTIEDGIKSRTFVSSVTEQSILDQLEDGKVIRAFWELRQEVAVLSRVQHPCIVEFLGVCHSPLCFVLELAPGGCLRDYLEDASQQRKAVIRQSNSFIPPSDSIMGRKLTHSIAVQVARALAYLHDSEIIYRDLKSDNILVWSLSEESYVNVKLSDYGISCFATPQGVIGEGGTPGFQAPEVKTGCAYDEKVDLFSYGIWLYELISGNRPFEEHRSSAEIKRAVQRGMRPSLAQVNIDSRMPCLDQLMMECWNEDPPLRPSAAEVVSRLEDVQFYVLNSSLPRVDQNRFESISCVFPLTSGQLCQNSNNSVTGDSLASQQRRILVWSSQRSQRKFVILAADSGIIQTDLACPGPRVLCAAEVGDRIWLGTEGCEIQVFGRYELQLPKILWSVKTKDAVTSLLVQRDTMDDTLKVYSSLANGTLMVFKQISRNRHMHLPLDTIENRLQREQAEWAEPTLTAPYLTEPWVKVEVCHMYFASALTIGGEVKLSNQILEVLTLMSTFYHLIVNLANRGLVAKSMVLTNNNKELWVACGNCIVIIDSASLSILTQLRVFSSQRSLVTGLVTDGKRLWTIDRRSAFVYEWDVASRRRTFKFNCETESIQDKVIVEAVHNPLRSMAVPSSLLGERLAEEKEAAGNSENEDLGQDKSTSNRNAEVNDKSLFSTAPTPDEEPQLSEKPVESSDESGTYQSVVKPTENGDQLPVELKVSPPQDQLSIHRDRFATVKMLPGADQTDDEPGSVSSGTDKTKSKTINLLPLSPFLVKLGRKKQPSLMFARKRPSRHQEKPGRITNRSRVENEDFLTQNRPRTAALSGVSNRLTSIFLNHDTLWLGRASGDVIVINVRAGMDGTCSEEDRQEDAETAYGTVLAQLSDIPARSSEISKEVTDLTLVYDLIVAATRIEMVRSESPRLRTDKPYQTLKTSPTGEFFKLISYESWIRKDFEKFVDRREKLSMMEKGS